MVEPGSLTPPRMMAPNAQSYPVSYPVECPRAVLVSRQPCPSPSVWQGPRRVPPPQNERARLGPASQNCRAGCKRASARGTAGSSPFEPALMHIEAMQPHFQPWQAAHAPCWHCAHFLGMLYEGTAARCRVGPPVRSMPGNGCSAFEREPGADDEPGPPAAAGTTRGGPTR